MDEKRKTVGIVTATFYGGETESGHIEFYEYSRSLYGLSRLISTVEATRRSGKVPGRITGASNVELFMNLPERGSFKYVTNLYEALSHKIKTDVSFPKLFSWAAGKSLDNLDLFNGNSDAIIAQDAAVNLDIDEEASLRRRRRRTVPELSLQTGEPKELTEEELAVSSDNLKSFKDQRVSQETDMAVAREFRKVLEESPLERLEFARRRVDHVEELAQVPEVQLFSEEERLLSALRNFADVPASSDTAAAERAARMIYATNDLEPRLNRRLLGDRQVPVDSGVPEGELEKLASRSRPLMREVVLPLRRSPEDMGIFLGKDQRKIVNIDKIRGRMISGSELTREVFKTDVFVIEYNRVAYSGRCTIVDLKVEVPFSLRKNLVRKLADKAIDGLKEENMTFITRAYLDDDGRVRSLLVEDIE